MKVFLVVAAMMAALAAAAVAVPLLRVRRSRSAGFISAVLISGAAVGLYPLWSNWDWRQPENAKAATDSAVLAMVAKLEQHLKEQPGDQTGWLMMGRSYAALERTDDAVAAYQHAYSLGKSAEADLGLAEALSMRAGGEITPQAAQLFDEALTLEPNDAKALFYGGFAAVVRGDVATARSRWETLKDQHPPPQIEAMLDARLAELGPAPAGEASSPRVSVSPGTSASGSGTNAKGAASAAALIAVNISIAAALKDRVAGGAPLFVFAREPGGTGPPLAAKRLTTAAIGTQVSLSAADSMIPGHTISGGQKVSITARVSFSGQPTPAAGDLFGEAAYEVGSSKSLDLVIDQVVGGLAAK